SASSMRTPPRSLCYRAAGPRAARAAARAKISPRKSSSADCLWLSAREIGPVVGETSKERFAPGSRVRGGALPAQAPRNDSARRGKSASSKGDSERGSGVGDESTGSQPPEPASDPRSGGPASDCRTRAPARRASSRAPDNDSAEGLLEPAPRRLDRTQPW